MQRANLDGQNLCSQIYGRDWIPEPPCHSTFKRRGGGGVRNWARISRAARIRAPRSMTLKRFQTPFAILPLIKGGGGPEWWGIDEGPHSCRVTFCIILPPLLPSVLHLTVRQGSFPLAPPCPPTSVHLPISETPKWCKSADVTRGLTRVEYCHVSL
jgi:hypothetical protein